MICTSSHKDWQSDKFLTYAISGDCGNEARYKGAWYPKLAPKYYFYKKWQDNIGKISEEENNRYYVQEYWNQVLSKLDPEEVYNEIDHSVLLCYEGNTEFCHRHIVAAWFEILLEIEVSEMKADGYNTTRIDRPSYIKEYLEDAMKMDRDMKGFNSLRALYLFEKAEELEKTADEMEARTRNNYNKYRQIACAFKADANSAEEKYNKEHYIKQLKLNK